MKTIISLLFISAVVAFAQPSDKPSGLADEYRAIEKEFDTAISEFTKAYATATTDEERAKLVQEKYPKPDKYLPRMRALAEKNPKDPAAVDPLIWIYRSGMGDPNADKMIDTLLQNHIQSEKMGKLAEMMAYNPMMHMHHKSPKTKAALEEILAKTPHREAKGLATFALGYHSYNAAGRRTLTPETERLFQEVIDKYGDIKGMRGSISDQAKGMLYAAKNLAVDKPAPEVEGEDLEGKKFKLSDYRGKVALIDFWGDW
jgi:hypothetical protein